MNRTSPLPASHAPGPRWLAALAVACWAASASCGPTLQMRVGTVEERLSAEEIAPGAELTTRVACLGAGDCVLLQTVTPDDHPGRRYDFELKCADRTFHRRSGATGGFGLRSLAIQGG